MRPIELLERGLLSYKPYLREDGEIIDPLMGEPTQYGTPYHALGRAVLALMGPEEHRAEHLAVAMRSVNASLNLVADPTALPTVSSVDSVTASIVSRLNHRDFFWPAILATYRILKQVSPADAESLVELIKSVDVYASFRSRPPNNWAMVWVSGEWMRIREGLSNNTLEDFDRWMDVFFKNDILVEQGFYQEPGHPNCYDLFTRYHLAACLVDGYEGRWKAQMERLMTTGLDRSLAVQLSDGSLASAYRTTGCSWIPACEAAYFTLCKNYFAESDPTRSVKAAEAARLAFASFMRWQRPNGPFSPVEHLLPPSYRLGYEPYTADAHHGNMPLGFFARGILDGFDDEPLFEWDREPTVFIEGDPTYRALVHRGIYSAHVNAWANDHYDGFGLVDLTFGPGRYLQWATSTKHLSDAHAWYNIGLALREGPGSEPLEIVAQMDPRPIGGFEQTGESSLKLAARVKGSSDVFQMNLAIDDDGVAVSERMRNRCGYNTLLVPYLRDCGLGYETEVEVDEQVECTVVTLSLGAEQIQLVCDGRAEHTAVLPYGYQSTRGLMGLIRIDLADPGEGVSYRISVIR